MVIVIFLSEIRELKMGVEELEQEVLVEKNVMERSRSIKMDSFSFIGGGGVKS